MKHVRQQIGHQLIDILHECNLADIDAGEAAEQAGNYYVANDLNWKCSQQHEAYGHIANALTSMGFNRAREVYASTGSIADAHDEIDAQYRGVAA